MMTDHAHFEKHKKEMLSFFIMKTAAVRAGVKPAELLRVNHCLYHREIPESDLCLQQHEVLKLLNLDYQILRNDHQSSLILFYNAQSLSHHLARKGAQKWLSYYRYPETKSVLDAISHLKKQFGEHHIPHEVGLFLGYPSKDVEGYIMQSLPLDVQNTRWRVYGNFEISKCIMNLHVCAERMASDILRQHDNVLDCLSEMNQIRITRHELQRYCS